jgi:hypothetical protein
MQDFKPGPPAEWMILKGDLIHPPAGQTATQWIAALGGLIVAQEQIQVVLASPGDTWYVVHFLGAFNIATNQFSVCPGQPAPQRSLRFIPGGPALSWALGNIEPPGLMLANYETH